MTDEELIFALRQEDDDHFGRLYSGKAADRIEALVKGLDDAIIKRAAWELEAKVQQARAERLEAALHNCVGMLDQLVAESGRDIEWGAEDPFRMGEWFEPEDLAQIEQARAALKGADHE